MLTGNEVTYTIDGVRLLDNVSVSFAPGELSLIVGANGAGKSTLMRVLSTQLKPQHGVVQYGSTATGEVDERDLARVRAVLSQNVELAFPLRVWEVVMMGRYPHFTGSPRVEDERACEEAMRYFDVLEWMDRNYLTLSGGERQRVQFARVMAQIWAGSAGRMRYLLLDEPLTFLDIRYQFDFLRKIRSLLDARDLVVVGVVHDLNLAARFADKLVLLANGSVRASGLPADVLQPGLIEEAFGIRPLVQETAAGLHLVF